MLLVFSFGFVQAGMQITEQNNGDYVCSFSPDYEIHYIGYFRWIKNGDTQLENDIRDYGSENPIRSESSTLTGVVLENGDTLKCEVQYALTAPNYGTLIDSITVKKEDDVITEGPIVGDVYIEPEKPFPTTDELTCLAPELPEEVSEYSWYKNNILIEGETSSILTYENAGGFSLGEIYKCKVKNALGGITQSYVYGSALVGITKDPNALAPEVSILEPINGGTATTGRVVSFSSLVEGGTAPFTYNWSSNISGELSTSQNFNKNDLVIGTHLITLEVTDIYGEKGTDSVEFTVSDLTAPTVSIVSPSNNDRFAQNDNIQFSATITDDDTVNSIVWTSSLDGELEDGRNEASFSATGLSQGTHTITVRAVDSDGLMSFDMITIFVSHNQAPKVSIVFPNNGDVFKQGDLVWFIGASDNEAAIEQWTWESNRDGFLSSNKIFSTQSLSTGTHKVTLTATDEYGEFHETEYRIEVLLNTQDFNAVSIVSPKNFDHFPLGQNIMFSAAIQNPEPTDTYMWGTDSGQGIIGTGNVVNVNNLQAGLHKISFTAAKADGSISQDLIEIYIDGPNDPTANILRPNNNAIFKESNTVTLSASGDNAWTYNWLSDVDGNLGSGKSISLSDMSIGKHIISLRVENGAGVSIDKRVIYILPQQSPSGSIISPVDGQDFIGGRDITFEVSAPSVQSGYWISDIQGTIGSTKTLTTSDLMIGQHTVTFVGFDADGNYVIDKVSFMIRQVSGPTVEITRPVNGQSFMEGQAVTFTGQATDPDGIISQWQWVSNVDGVIGNQEEFTKSDLSTGKHDITVTVVDNNGVVKYVATKTIWIFVGYDSLSVDITSPQDGASFAPLEQISFDSNPSLLAGRTVDSYEWVSSEDGVIGTTQNFTSDLSSGTHEITLTVVDSAGFVAIDTITITVGGSAPVVDSERPVAKTNGPFEIYEGQEVSFSSLGSYDPDGEIVRYEWHLGLGVPSFLENPTIKYEKAGNYTVNLFVTDDTGNIGSASTYVNVVSREIESAEDYKSARAGIFVSEIFMSNDGFYGAGDYANIQMTFRNNLPVKVKDMTVTAMIPELGLFGQAGPFSLGAKERRTQVVSLDIPSYVSSGEYYLRLSVYNGDHTRVFYRPIKIE